MKVLIVKSSLSGLPLAEVREAAGVIEFIVDNTGGHIPALVGKSYAKLVEYTSESPHLTVEEPQEPTAHLLRYVLSNGEIVEITTDGRSCTLNGQLLSEEQKQALFDAIRTGQVSITHKADPAKPEPIRPTSVAPVQAKLPEEQPFDRGVAKQLLDGFEKNATAGCAEYDPEIENARYAPDDSVGEIKSLWYHMKHGGGR